MTKRFLFFKLPDFLLIFTFLFSDALLFSQENRAAMRAATNYSSQEKNGFLDVQESITIDDYCAFLNAVSTRDPSGFYEAKMGSKPTSILRMGKPGSYFYSVCKERENSGMILMSCRNAASYCSWRADQQKNHQDVLGMIVHQAVDDELKSNQLKFFIQWSPVFATEAGYAEETEIETIVRDVLEWMLVGVSTQEAVRGSREEVVAQEIELPDLSHQALQLPCQEDHKKEQIHTEPTRQETEIAIPNTPSQRTQPGNYPHSKLQSKLRGDIDLAHRMELQKSILKELCHSVAWDKKSFYDQLQTLTKQEKRYFVTFHLNQILSDQENKRVGFKKASLAADPVKINLEKIRKKWKCINLLEQKNVWDSIKEALQAEISNQKRDAVTQRSSSYWENLLLKMDRLNFFWEEGFWEDYWFTTALRIKTIENERKNNVLFESLMEKLGSSNSKALRRLIVDFDTIIASAEKLTSSWHTIFEERQAALKKVARSNKKFQEELQEELEEAEEKVSCYPIEVLFFKAQKESKIAHFLLEQAMTCFPNNHFKRSWEKVECMLPTIQRSWCDFRDALLTKREETERQNGMELILEKRDDWLHEAESDILFWKGHESWSRAVKEEILAEEMIVRFFDPKLFFKNDRDFLVAKGKLLFQVKEVVSCWRLAADAQKKAVRNVAPMYQASFQEDYEFAISKLNEWQKQLNDCRCIECVWFSSYYFKNK